jgi:hypothetical protein
VSPPKPPSNVIFDRNGWSIGAHHSCARARAEIGLPGLAASLVETMGSCSALTRAVIHSRRIHAVRHPGSEVLEEGAGGKRSFRFILARFGQLRWRRSTAPAHAPSRRCCRPCRSTTWSLPAIATAVPARFTCRDPEPHRAEGTYPLPEAQPTASRCRRRRLSRLRRRTQNRFDTTGTEENVKLTMSCQDAPPSAQCAACRPESRWWRRSSRLCARPVPS